MTKGSGKSGSRAVSVPVKSTVSFKSSGGGVGSYQNKSQVSYGDKQTGSYGRQTTTQKAFAGDFHWKNGTTGTRTEYTERNTVRVGDRRGYTEVRNEQTFRNVTYDRSGCGGKSYISYNNNDGGSYGGYGSESDDGDQSGGGYDSSDNDDVGDQAGGYYDSESEDGDESGGGYYSNSDDGGYGGDSDGYDDDSDY